MNTRFSIVSLSFNVVVALLSLLISSHNAAAQQPSTLRFVFQKQKDPALIREQAEKVGDFLSGKLAAKVETQVPSDYAAAVQALVSEKADVAYVDSLAFLLARRDGGAKLLLAEKRTDIFGQARTEYDSIFVVPVDSNLKSFDDLVTNASKLRMVFTSPTSTSGYVIPYRRFVQAGLSKPKQDLKTVFKSVSFGGSYTQALEELLAARADVAAVSYYTLEGPRADAYLSPDKRSKLRILARTPGVPTHVIVTRRGISDSQRDQIKRAVLDLAREKPELLSDVYGTADFTEVDPDAHVKASAEAVELIGLPIEGLVNPKKSS